MASTLDAQTAPERHHADRREVTEGTRRDDVPRHLLEKLHHKAPTVEGGGWEGGSSARAKRRTAADPPKKTTR